MNKVFFQKFVLVLAWITLHSQVDTWKHVSRLVDRLTQKLIYQTESFFLEIYSLFVNTDYIRFQFCT
jgi:hypothetical protein